MKKIGLILIVLLIFRLMYRFFFVVPYYHLVAINSSQTSYDKVVVQYDDGKYFSFGYFAPPKESAIAVNLGVWPKEVSISWIITDKPEQTYRQRIQVPPYLNSSRDELLQLIIEFKGDQIVAYSRVQEDMYGLKYRYEN